MSFTGPGWYLLSTTTDQTLSQAMASWGISTSTVYKYMYELKNAPILASPTVQLTADNWTGTDISANPTSLLNPMKAYWVNIQTLIVDMILSGTGTLDNATPPFNGATNVIIQGYTAIGNQAFYGVKNLSSITIPASVTSIAYQAFYNTLNLSTVTFAANTQLKSSSIVSNAFSNSGLKTVIFESINDLESLGFKLINTPQDFFGAIGVQVLPTKAAVDSALSAAIITSSLAQEQIQPLTNAVTIAEIPYNQAQKAYDQADKTRNEAQANLNNTKPQWIFPPDPPFFPQGIPNPEYTAAYNNLVNALAALAMSNAQLISANAQLTLAQENLKNAQTQVTTANDLVTKLRNVTWVV